MILLCGEHDEDYIKAHIHEKTKTEKSVFVQIHFARTESKDIISFLLISLMWYVYLLFNKGKLLQQNLTVLYTLGKSVHTKRL